MPNEKEKEREFSIDANNYSLHEHISFEFKSNQMATVVNSNITFRENWRWFQREVEGNLKSNEINIDLTFHVSWVLWMLRKTLAFQLH